MARNTYAAEIAALYSGLNKRRQIKSDEKYRQQVLAENIRSNKEQERIKREDLANRLAIQGSYTARAQDTADLQDDSQSHSLDILEKQDEYRRGLIEFGEKEIKLDEATRTMMIKSGAMPESWDGTVPRNMVGAMNKGAFGLMTYANMFEKEAMKDQAEVKRAQPIYMETDYKQLGDPIWTNEDKVLTSMQISLDSLGELDATKKTTSAEKLINNPKSDFSTGLAQKLERDYMALNAPWLAKSGLVGEDNYSGRIEGLRSQIIRHLKGYYEKMGIDSEAKFKELDKQYYTGKGGKPQDLKGEKAGLDIGGKVKSLANESAKNRNANKILRLSKQIERMEANGDTTSARYKKLSAQLNNLK